MSSFSFFQKLYFLIKFFFFNYSGRKQFWQDVERKLKQNGAGMRAGARNLLSIDIDQTEYNNFENFNQNNDENSFNWLKTRKSSRKLLILEQKVDQRCAQCQFGLHPLEMRSFVVQFQRRPQFLSIVNDDRLNLKKKKHFHFII